MKKFISFFLTGCILMFLIRMISATQTHSYIYIGSVSLFTLVGYIKPKFNIIPITLPLLLIDLILLYQNKNLFPFIVPTEYLLAVLGFLLGKKISLLSKFNKKITLAFSLFLINLILLWSTPHLEYQSKTKQGTLGKISAQFSLVDYNGKSFSYSDFQNKIVFLDFWTTFCSSCIKNFPNIEKIRKHFASDSSILVLSINLGVTPDSYSRFRKFIKTKKLNTNRFLYDKNSTLSKDLKIDKEGVPQHFIIKDNTIIWTHKGITNDELIIFSKKIIDEINIISNSNTIN